MRALPLTLMLFVPLVAVACGRGAAEESAFATARVAPAAPAPAALPGPSRDLFQESARAVPALPAPAAPAPAPAPAPPRPAPAPAPAAPAPTRSLGLSGEPGPELPTLIEDVSTDEEVALVSQRRIIVRTVAMELEVADVSRAIDDVSALAQELGGWVVSSDRSLKHRGFISIRVPADGLDDAILRLRRLAVEVESEVSTSKDVTDEYVDTTARLKNLQATEEALLKLFDKALSVEEALMVQEELTRVQGEIERLQGRISFLEQTSAFSLINVALRLAPVEIFADAGPDQTFSVGQVARFRASFRPPEDVEDFNFIWDFGDGSPRVTGSRTAPSLEEGARFTDTITHVYQDDRDSPFIVEFQITGTGDLGVVEGKDTVIVTVTKVPTIEVFAGERKTVREGDEVEVVGSFTRPEGLRDLRFKWDFGDGSAPVTGSLAGGVTRAIATHVYSDHRPVPFTATMTITAESDAGEVEASSSIAVLVTEAPGIEVFAGRGLTVKEDEEVEFAGSFTRPEGMSDLRFKWDFGDGSAPVTGELLAGDTRAVATHAYPDQRPFPFTATLTVTGRRDTREVESLSSISVLVEESQGWVLSGWSAGDNWKTATRALSAVGQGVGTFLIWLGIFSPVWIVVGALTLYWRRRNRGSTRGPASGG